MPKRLRFWYGTELVSISVHPSAYEGADCNAEMPVMLTASISDNERDVSDSFFIVIGLALIVTFYKGCSLCATEE